MDPEKFCSALLNMPQDLTQRLGGSDELVKSSISIFAKLPMSRQAVIEYYSQYIFEKAIADYMSNVTKSPNRMEEDYNVLTEIQQGLTNLVFEHPSEFATPISSWSIQLLGKLSQKYDKIVENPNNNKVWMECDAVRALLSLAAIGFWKTNNIEESFLEKDECVSMLLETYIKYSPAADWIVGRLASSYTLPLTTRVLYNGLCIFQKSSQNGNHIKSVILILEQLAEGHMANLDCASKKLVHWSFAKNNRNNLRRFVIPYMLHLASSDKLLPLVYSTILELFTSPDAHAIILSNQRHHLWINIGLKYTILVERTAELALMVKDNPLKICLGLLDKSDKCAFGLHVLMQVLNHIGKKYRKSSEHYPLVISLSDYGDYKDLCNLLISPNVNQLKVTFILHILNYIGHCKPIKFPKIIHYLLYHITSVSKLPLLLNLVQSHYFTGVPNTPFSNLFDVLQMTFTAPKQSEFIYTFFWENLCNLIQQEKQGRTIFLEQGNFTKAAFKHISNIIKFFEEILDKKLQNITKKIVKEEKELTFKKTYYNTEIGNKSSIFNMKTVCENQNHYSSICDNIARILEMLDINLITVANHVNRIIVNNETYQKLINVIVKYFFYSLLLRKPSRRRSSIIAIRLLSKCCSSNRIGRILGTQLLVDGAVFKYSLLFGATTPAYKHGTQSISLFDLNIKQGFTSQMSQRPLAVFRNEMDLNRKSPSVITETCFQRQRLLFEALSAAMSENVLSGPSTDALTSLSLWLVESVSTDVMYNGLPWPEDEFTKITMERDLHIRRMFHSTPVLWSLLRFVAYHRPALCYCSVLLRGLTSVLIYQWLSWSYKNTPDTIFQELHATTRNVLQTLSLAQLLPPPLDTLSEVIPKLKAFEISFVLKECVWFYMKENVPAPVLFQETQLGHYWRDPLMSYVPLRFIEPLRMVMQKHLPHLASNYNQIFIQDCNRMNGISK